MSFTIRNNWLGLKGSNQIDKAWEYTMRSLERLSTGMKINRASDSPAGLMISEQLRSRIASLNQEIDNTSALINKYQTASSTVSEGRSLLTEVRTLAVGAANSGGNDEASQAAWATTADHVVNQYNRVIETASYNGHALFDGSEQAVAEISGLSDIDLSTAEAAEASIGKIDSAMAELDSVQGELGATQRYELEARRESLQITAQNLQAAESVLRDTDYAKEFSNFVAGSIQLRASVALMSHSFLTAKNTLNLLQMSINS
ncbi:MAG: flagellin [bacterium]